MHVSNPTSLCQTQIPEHPCTEMHIVLCRDCNNESLHPSSVRATPDLTTDLSLALPGQEVCDPVIVGALPGDAQALKIYGLQFLCPVTASSCSGYIGQSSPFPGDVNTLTVTLAISGENFLSNESFHLSAGSAFVIIACWAE